MAGRNGEFRIRQFIKNVQALPGGPGTIVVNPTAGGAVTKLQMEDWASHRETSDSPIVEIYLRMICHHVNTQAGLIGPGTPPNAVPDIIMLSSQAYNRMLENPGGHILAAIELQDAGITRAIFQRIQYVFIPMHVNGHWALIVVSPIDRTVEILDSYRAFTNWPRRSDNALVKVFQFLEYFLGPHFIPAQWQTMDTESPLQKDYFSCGVYTCKNAMSIACRLPLDPDTFHETGVWPERARIGAEVMNRDFTGIFNIHRVNAHPGPANRLANSPWRPLNQHLLTLQRRQQVPPRWTKTLLTFRCRALNAARGNRWMRGHSRWAAPGRTRAQFLAAIEQRLNNIYRGVYTT
jgi:hypothetical protein